MMNNKSRKMYDSIIRGLQDSIDLLSTEESFDDIIPIDVDDTGSDNKNNNQGS